jgi:hypothetical protein
MPEQSFEQHSALAEQSWPRALQHAGFAPPQSTGDEGGLVAPQHWLESEQLALIGAQQVPPVHGVVQHSLPAPHAPCGCMQQVAEAQVTPGCCAPV